jgi:YidC/Oxa1 family membrane protein insertase
MSNVWYYALQGKSVGPLSLADLTAILSNVSTAKDVLVWRDGFEQWQRADTVPELANFVTKLPQPPPLPPPLPLVPPDFQREPLRVQAAVQDHEDRPQYRKIRADRVGPSGSHRNIIAAIALSAIVLIAWQYFFTMPQEKVRQQQLQALPSQQQAQPNQQQALLSQQLARVAALASSPRIPITSDSLQGSIALKGGRIDDLAMETIDPKAPPIVLLSPSGSPHPFYAEFGWTGTVGANVKLPTSNTVWTQASTGVLSVSHPVTLTWSNGEGLEFRRTIAVDDKYLFTIKDEVVNKTASPISLYPYALISRHGTPKTAGYYIVHEGPVGVLGEKSLQEFTYKNMEDKKLIDFDITNGWLGITDKYWAAALLPDTTAHLRAHFATGKLGTQETYQTDYLLDAQTIAPGATGSANARLFAGAKEVAVVNNYEKQLNLNRFDLLIDWGWFYFITKPLFFVIDYIYRLLGNFGVAILVLTTIIKLIFVPFANQSYRSMIKMQGLQPKIAALRERFPEPERANKEIIELYKHENITAPSGCLPIVIQFLVFFALFKILSVTIEAHSPFFGWIQDLAARDPTNAFNLFGLIQFDPMTVPVVGHFLHLGALPIILGLTVWQLQRKISPALLGSFQRKAYAALPLLVVYFCANTIAGLLIYFIWYNFLSIIHQWLLMKKQKDTIGNITKYSAEFLPYGKIQPIVFLTMLTPILQNLLTVLVFWRRSKTPKIENSH